MHETFNLRKRNQSLVFKRAELANDPSQRFEIWNLDALDPTDYITVTFYTVFSIIFLFIHK